MTMTAYQLLEQQFNRISQLSHLGAMAHWDMAVMMPKGGQQARASALAELSVIQNELLCDPQVADWISQAADLPLDVWQQANLREIKRQWLHATSISADLVAAKSLASSECEYAWRTLRAENNWHDFLPLFTEVVKLSREAAQQRASAMNLPLYDALLDLYEPGQTAAQLEALFTQLKRFLPDFVQKVVAQQAHDQILQPKGPFPIEQQRQLGLELMRQIGFDFEHGRLDISHHPFCGGVPNDVRLTTRYNSADFSESLLGVLHETGHAKYEQGLPKNWANQPVGKARSMGIHESQSLLMEMQVSRSRAFFQYATPIIQQHLGTDDQPPLVWQADNLYLLNNRVKPDYIRVNADEVTYPLHIILRYEIEKALIEDQIQAADVPSVWDEKMQEYLGLSTLGNDENGCMQDIHWPGGSFGYFPTYTLGAMNAAQMFAAANRAIPKLAQNIEQGDFTELNQWQADHIWSQGCYYSTNELMLAATGETLNPDYFIKHLEQRYLAN